jgi:hypothetical protein
MWFFLIWIESSNLQWIVFCTNYIKISKLVFSYETIMVDALNIINFKIGDIFAKLQNNSGL